MNVWLLVAIFGVGGGLVGVALDVQGSLNDYREYPWRRKHGKPKPLGVGKWIVLSSVNVFLGGAAAAAFYLGHQVKSLSGNEIIDLAAAGLSAPAVLHKMGRAIPK